MKNLTAYKSKNIEWDFREFHENMKIPLQENIQKQHSKPLNT